MPYRSPFCIKHSCSVWSPFKKNWLDQSPSWKNSNEEQHDLRPLEKNKDFFYKIVYKIACIQAGRNLAHSDSRTRLTKANHRFKFAHVSVSHSDTHFFQQQFPQNLCVTCQVTDMWLEIDCYQQTTVNYQYHSIEIELLKTVVLTVEILKSDSYNRPLVS